MYAVMNFRDQFVDYWIGGNMLTMDLATRMYTILKQPDRRYLTQVIFSFFNEYYLNMIVHLYETRRKERNMII